MKQLNRMGFIASTVMVLMFFTGCGDGKGENTRSVSISITETLDVLIGETKTLNVTRQNTADFTVSVNPATGSGCVKNGNDAVICTPTEEGTYTVTVTAAADTTKKADATLTVVDNGVQIQWSARYALTTRINRIDGYVEGADYPVVTVIYSESDLEQYFKDFESRYDFYSRPGSKSGAGVGFMDAIEDYTDAFFSGKYVVFVLLEETSGSIRHEVEAIAENGDIVIRRLVPSGAATDDMAQWHVIIELENNFDPDQFNVLFVDESVIAPVAHETASQIPVDIKYVRTNGYVDGVNYPIITVISSESDLEQYCRDFENRYDLSSRPGYQPGRGVGFMDVIEDYTDAFFSGKYVVFVLLEETSGSIRHEVESIAENGDIVIRRFMPSTSMTADMAQWHIMIEFDAGFAPERFDVRLVD